MEGMMILFFSPALFMNSNAAPAAVSSVGPFDIIVTDLKHCPEPSKGMSYDLKMVKMTRKKIVVAVNLTFDRPLDDELTLSVNLAKQTNQGWKENFFILEAPKACTNLKAYVPQMENELAEQMKCGHCPYPAGNYSVTLSLQIELKGFAVFPYGKYLTKSSLMKNHKRVFCLKGFVEVVPKKSG